MQDGVPIEARMVSRAIERAQTQVEGRNFEIRKNLLDYDDVMNKQREAIYQLRSDILRGKESHDYVQSISGDVIEYLVDSACPEKADPRDWDFKTISSEMYAYFDIKTDDLGVDLVELGTEELVDTLKQAAADKYNAKLAVDEEGWTWEVRRFLLRAVDVAWKDHLLALDHLKEGIGLRGYGQRDPKNEYKRESYELFTAMKDRIEDAVIKTLYRLEPISAEEAEQARKRRQIAPRGFKLSHADASGIPAAAQASKGPPTVNQGPQKPQTVVRNEPKVGRNDPCPCGSGKKYKKCHGAAS
jgi:preprotein translocase subunit SecA